MKSSLGLLLFGLCALSQAGPVQHGRPRGRRPWRGWDKMKYMFVFGDSYTSTWFDINGEQPNPSNPIGNPPYPGWTSANGPNWVGFLTAEHNVSYIETFNLAYGGATVDSALVAPWQPTVLSLKDQVEDLFIPKYGANDSALWNPHNTLFAFWIGINDVGNSFWLDINPLYDQIFAVYRDLLEQVIALGAKNILLLNVPPFDRAPLQIGQGPDSQAIAAAGIANFNARIVRLASSIERAHRGTVVFEFNTHELYTNALNDPTAYPETALYKNLTAFCNDYQNGTPDWYTFIPSCGIPVNEYFWFNSLHPTFPVHNATAREISEFLSSC